MPAPERPARRQFLFLGASAGLAAAGVGGGVLSERTQPRPNIAAGNAEVLFRTDSRSRSEQARYIARLRREAGMVSQRITPLTISEGTLQENGGTTSKMHVNTEHIAEAALLFGDMQGVVKFKGKKINIRDIVAGTILQRGIQIHISDEAPEQTPEGPLKLNIPTTLQTKTIENPGGGSQTVIDDFPVLAEVYGLVNYIVGSKLNPGVSADNNAAIAVEAGFGAAAATEAFGLTRSALRRREVLRAGIAAAAGGVVFYFGNRGNVGGETLDIVNSKFNYTPPLGDSYAEPSNDFKPLFFTPLFRSDIQYKLVVKEGKKAR